MKGFIHKQWTFEDSIEHEYYYAGDHGGEKEQKAERKKKTPEEMKAINQKNKEKKVRHLIKQNFHPGDYFATLNFGDEYIGRSLTSLRKKEIRNFLDRIKREYKKAGIPFKFIIRMELGSRKKRPHIHIIMNRIEGLDKIIQRQWTYGKQSPHIELLGDDKETPKRLADYITKPSPEQEIAADAYCDGDLSKVMYYSCSRNLERPVPKKTVITSRTMLSVFNHDLKPTKGYQIDKDPETLKRGINPYTGLTFLYYQEIKLKPKEIAMPVKLCECPVCHQLAFEGLTCNCQKRKNGKRLRR